MWQIAVLSAVKRLCQRHGNLIFTRQLLIDEELDRIIKETSSRGATPAQTMSRVLQELKKQGYLEFVDDQGTYRLL
jgi:putative restriction endonuclease